MPATPARFTSDLWFEGYPSNGTVKWTALLMQVPKATTYSEVIPCTSIRLYLLHGLSKSPPLAPFAQSGDPQKRQPLATLATMVGVVSDEFVFCVWLSADHLPPFGVLSRRFGVLHTLHLTHVPQIGLVEVGRFV